MPGFLRDAIAAPVRRLEEQERSSLCVLPREAVGLSPTY